MLKAVIFDMDGVIIDSEIMHAQVNQTVLKKYGIEVSLEYCFSFVGSTLKHMMETIIHDFQMEVSLADLIKECNEEKERIIRKVGYVQIPGVISLIQNLHKNNIHLAIASSSNLKEIKNVLTYFHIEECFQAVISGESCKHPKPAPDIFLKALNELHVSADECVIIEDSMLGTMAAQAAGIKCFGFINEHSGTQDLSRACKTFDHFNELNTEMGLS